MSKQPRRGGVARYRLLASAIAGRLVDVAAVEEEGGAAWTDGATIFVDADGDPRDVLCAVVVQASLLACGSLTPDVVSTLGRRASVLRRYLALEGHRAVTAQEGLLPAAARGLVDQEVAARSDSPSASRDLALGAEVIAAPPAVFGTIRPRQLRRAIDPPPGPGQETQVAPRSERPMHEFDESPEREAPVVDIRSGAVGRGGAVGRLLKKFFADTRSRGGGAAGAAMPTHWTKRRARGNRSTPVSSSAARPTEVGFVERGFRTYPEWDVNRGQYRPSWCTVVDVEETREDAAPPLLGDVHALRRPLARLGVDLERRRRQLQGDDIDIDAAVEAHVSTPRALLRKRRSTSTVSGRAVTCRCSSCSTSPARRRSPGSPGRPCTNSSRRSPARWSLRCTSWAIASRCTDSDRAGGPRCTSRRSSASTRRSTRGRFAGSARSSRSGTHVSVPRSGTVLPSSKKQAVRRGGCSSSFPTGSPTTTVMRGTTAKPMRAARWPRRGSAAPRALVSVSAQRPNRDALRRVFGSAALATLSRPEQLPDVVGPLFRAALRSADYQRRTWQRTERTRERLKVERQTG